MIEIKSLREIEMMRASCKIAAECLFAVGKQIKVGVSTDDINDFVHQFILDRHAIPAPLGYRGSNGTLPPFPKSCCTSINEIVCHGIPSKRLLREGDIINVDITSILDGFHGDTSATFAVGTVAEEARKVTEVARNALWKGIEAVKPGNRLGDIGFAIESYINEENFFSVREFVGHGIGRAFHMPPQVFHYGNSGTGARLLPGMTFTIEPMVNIGTPEIIVDEDCWTVRTLDGSLSAQFEHTILVTATGYEVLTQL